VDRSAGDPGRLFRVARTKLLSAQLRKSGDPSQMFQETADELAAAFAALGVTLGLPRDELARWLRVVSIGAGDLRSLRGER